MLVLSYIVASHYYNCCTDGSTSPGNYGYPLLWFLLILRLMLILISGLRTVWMLLQSWGVGGVKMGAALNYETWATLRISTLFNSVYLAARRSYTLLEF
jgi:hypothetical protein